ncbi:MAG: hypothetical protein ACOYN0_02195 [Phycisphaerales bacterium]
MVIEDSIAQLIRSEGVVIPAMVGFFIITGVIVSNVGRTIRSNAREKTRREIAAYIAEGSMTPEQGERLMKAGEPKDC